MEKVYQVLKKKSMKWESLKTELQRWKYLKIQFFLFLYQ